MSDHLLDSLRYMAFGMSVNFRTYKYHADFELVRNGFRIRKCNESGETIWPLQLAYRGEENLRFPLDVYWLTPDQYLILKIKNEVA